LADSIATDGQKLPIVVRASGREDFSWIIIDGERRFRACQLIRRHEIRAFVSRVNHPKEVFTDQVIANFFREGHTPFETARAIFRLREMGMSVAKVARLVGKSEPWVYQHLQLLKLAPEVTELMEPDIDSAHTVSSFR
jgi:ParB family chromosome partitioning protein